MWIKSTDTGELTIKSKALSLRDDELKWILLNGTWNMDGQYTFDGIWNFGN